MGVSKKAERIYKGTKARMCVDMFNGYFYDAYGGFICKDTEVITISTLNDMLKMWKSDLRNLERDMRMYDRHPEFPVKYEHTYKRFVRDTEVLRRMYLTIKSYKESITW